MNLQRETHRAVKELRLHVGPDKRIWYAHDATVRAVDDPPEEFASRPLVKQAQKVMFLGTQANAAMIRAVYISRKGDIPSRRIMIASPRAALRKGDESPETVFSRMATNVWPSSVGGWRMVTSHDFVIYSLIHEVQKGRDDKSVRISDSAVLYLRQHPAWPAISFIYRHQPVPACLLLTEIIDPRWHIDVDYPDRHAKLRNFLGLSKAANIQLALNVFRGYGGEWPPMESKRLYRSMLTIASWYGEFVKHPELTKDLGKHLREPRAFLLRHLYEPKEDEQHDIRFVRTNDFFIEFLQTVWLDNLYPNRRYRRLIQKLGHRSPERVTRYKMLCPRGYERTLFVPEHFFVEMDEVEAWKRHVSKLKKATK